jgi:hypothetical protein
MNEEPPVAVWEALAEHFLDTENRSQLPRHALICLESGLTRSRARDVWCYEVTPAVWLNLWIIAGEWGSWRTEWLIPRVEAKRGRWPNRPGLFARLVYRLRVGWAHQYWVALERCMELFEGTEPAERSLLADDLTWLAEHFFCPRWGAENARDPQVLRKLYATAFLPIFSELVIPNAGGQESSAACRARVEIALGVTTASLHPYRGRSWIS